MKTQIIASFCGTGKSYLCKHNPNRCREIECWNFRSGDFPNNYIAEIEKLIGNVKYLFISTDPVILKQLHKIGINPLLIYPKKSLKSEYMKRFCDRNSSYDFLGVIYKHWEQWLNELKSEKYCKQKILKSGQYLGDLFPELNQ